MPDNLLHQGATVFCLHMGQATIMPSNTRVLVDGQPVAVLGDPTTIAGCPFYAGAPSPCITAQWVTAATRVRAGGVPVLLENSQASCIPNGTGVKVVFIQGRVKGQ